MAEPTPAARTAGAPADAGIYVVAAHPNWAVSRVNRRLKAVARKATGVHVRDLYATYPDYDIDVAAEQARLEAARLIVWLHPIHWYSMPALMKLWVDDVLAFGWAYGTDGNKLKGKDLWLVATTGGPEDSYHPQGYNRYFFDAFLPPYEQTAALCGMRFLPPLLLHGAHRVHDDVIASHAAMFVEKLETWPNWPEMDQAQGAITCEVPETDRPDEDDDTLPEVTAAVAAARELAER